MKDKIKLIPYKIMLADTFLKRLKGLMFRKNPILNEGLLIKPCNSIHMFFMHFPIDVVFLNEQNQIVKLNSDVQPWSIIRPIKEAYTTLELPAGAIKKLGLEVGDGINLTYQVPYYSYAPK